MKEQQANLQGSSDSEQQARLYDKLAEKAQELFRAGRDKGSEAMEAAIENARKQLTEAGEFSAELGKDLKAYLLKDLDRVVAFSRELGGEARERLEPARLGTGALASLSSLLHLAEGALHGLAEKTDQALACNTGELTSAGSLTCENCGKTMQLKKTGHVPPCPGCKNTRFKKGY